MDITIYPRPLQGQVKPVPSKSQAHRLLICAAFADQETMLFCDPCGKDIEATIRCLNALGARITRETDGYRVIPVETPPAKATINCGESGSTLRFMLPILGALGVDAVLELEGRLPQRPLHPLWEEMERMGCKLQWLSGDRLHCAGKLRSGVYRIPGNISSQFVSGLLLAFPLMDDDSSIEIMGEPESKSYIVMTQQVMQLFGVDTEGLRCSNGQKYRTPGQFSVEGDWSNAAVWLAARAMSNGVSVSGPNPDSCQADKAVVSILRQMQAGNITLSAKDIPDAIPVLAIAAGALQGATFTDIQRLRLKESDRVAAIVDLIQNVGGHAEATETTLTVYPGKYRGGVVDGCNDHRIVMAAALAATVCSENVTIYGAEAIQKSYPEFWDVYKELGGQYD